MKSTCIAIIAGLTLLSGCGEAPSAKDTPAEAVAKSEKMQAKAAAAIESKDLGELIDYFNAEGEEALVVMKSVTDKASAEAAVLEIRTLTPRLKAAMKEIESRDVSDIKASMAMMKKLPKLVQTQGEMMVELQRISEIPEARAVLEEEFDKLDVFK